MSLIIIFYMDKFFALLITLSENLNSDMSTSILKTKLELSFYVKLDIRSHLVKVIRFYLIISLF